MVSRFMAGLFPLLWEIRISLGLGMRSPRVQGLCALTGGSFPCRPPISGQCRAGLLMTLTMVSGGTAGDQGCGFVTQSCSTPALHVLVLRLCLQ